MKPTCRGCGHRRVCVWADKRDANDCEHFLPIVKPTRWDWLIILVKKEDTEKLYPIIGSVLGKGKQKRFHYSGFEVGDVVFMQFFYPWRKLNELSMRLMGYSKPPSERVEHIQINKGGLLHSDMKSKKHKE